MALSKTRERINNSPEETRIKISELPKYGFKVPENFIKEYGESLIAKSKIDKDFTTKTTDEKINTLKGLIGLKSIFNKTEKSDKLLKERITIGEKVHNKSEKEAKSYLNSSLENLTKGTGEVTEKIKNSETIKEFSKKTSEITEKGKKAFKGSKTLLWLNEMKEKGGFLGFLAGGLLSFIGLFGFGKGLKKAKEIGEKAENLLKPEKREDIRKNIKNSITNHLKELDNKLNKNGLSNFLVSPKEKKQLNSLIDDPKFLNDSELKKVQELIKKGEIKKITDLKGVLPKEKTDKLFSIIFSKERENRVKLLMTTKLSEAISERYKINTDLTGTKRKKLNELVENYCIPKDGIELADNFINGEWISGGDMLETFFGTILNSGIFVIKLFSNGIIGAGDLLIRGMDSASNIGSLSLAGYGVDFDITNDVLDEFSKLSSEKKAMLFGIMAREGGAIFQLLSSVSFYANRAFVETIIKAPGNGAKLSYHGFINNFEGQIKELQKINSSLGMGNDVSDGFKELKTNLDDLTKRTEVLKIIKKGGNIEETLKKIKGKNSFAESIFKKIEGKKLNTKEIKNVTFKELTFNPNKQWFKRFKERTAGVFKKGNYHQILNETLKVEQNINQIYKNQRRWLSGGISQISLKNLSSILDYKRLNQNVTNLKMNIMAKDFPNKMDTLKQIAKESPQLLSAIVGSRMTISIVKGNLKSGDFDINKTINELSFLVPIVGPLRILYDGKVRYSNGKFETEDAALIGSSLIFLGLDGATIISNPTHIFKYMLSPIKAPLWDLPVGAIRTSRLGFDLYKGQGSLKLLQAIKSGSKAKINQNIKAIRTLPGAAKLVAFALLVSYIGYKYLKTSEREELYEAGFVNEDDTLNLKKIKEGTSQEEKELIFNEIILSKINSIEGLKIEKNNDSIKIISTNPKYPYINPGFLLDKYFFILKEIYGIKTENITFVYEGDPIPKTA